MSTRWFRWSLPFALCLLGPALLAQTLLSGQVTDSTTGAPVSGGFVGLVRSSSLAFVPPGTRVYPEQLLELDAGGGWSTIVPDDDATWSSFHVFSAVPARFNHIHGSGTTSYGFPLVGDFALPGVTAFGNQLDATGVDFALPSNLTTSMVPMRDGVVSLATDSYLARAGTPDATVLIRTPYGKGAQAGLAYFTLFGFHVVVQDARGRFDSEGDDTVFRSDGWGVEQDGYDTIEWIAEQPWSNGRVGTYGGSASAIMQYLAAGAAPPHLSCCFAVTGTGTLYDDLMFPGGIFRESLIEGWLASQGTLGFLDDLHAHPDKDAWWDVLDLAQRYDRVDVPVFHLAGWFDFLLPGATEGFAQLQVAGGPGAVGRQKLLIGPWDHHSISQQAQGQLVFPTSATLTKDENWELRFFDYWLKDQDTAGFAATAPVHYYVMGDVDDPLAPGNTWRDANSWPVPSIPVRVFLAPGHTPSLSLDEPFPADAIRGVVQGTAAAKGSQPPGSVYTADPADPVPTLGGANLLLPSGPYDQSALEARPDVLTFDTGPLPEPLEITGALSARLYLTASAPDFDVVVKLMDVYPDGRSMLIQEGQLQARHREGFGQQLLVVPGSLVALDVDMLSTSLVLNTGHRLRISISSSNAPRLAVNPNTGEPFGQASGQQPVTVALADLPGLSSYVTLPVVPLAAGADR